MRHLVSDLDGTLLNSEHIVSPETVQALHDFTNIDGTFVLATGRPYFEVEPILHSISTNCPVICLNGAIIYDAQGHIIFSKPMDSDVVFRMMKKMKGRQWNYDIVTGSSVYKIGSLNRLLQIYESSRQPFDLKLLAKGIQNNHIKLMDENEVYPLLKEEILDIYKIIVYDDQLSSLEEFACWLREAEDVEITSSLELNVEINAVGVSKGNALTFLAKQMGYSLQDFISVGDSINDLSMFQVCGLRAAMDNGSPKLQQKADIITFSNDENGVAELIRRELLH